MSECCGRTGNIWRMKSTWRILLMRWWRLGFLLPRIREISWWCSPARAKWRPKSSWMSSSRPARRGTRCLPPCSTPWEQTTDTRPWWRNWTSPVVTLWWFTHWWKTVRRFLVIMYFLELLNGIVQYTSVYLFLILRKKLIKLNCKRVQVIFFREKLALDFTQFDMHIDVSIKFKIRI